MEVRSAIGIAVPEAEALAHEAGILLVSSAGKYALEIPWRGTRRVVEAELMQSTLLGVKEEGYAADPDSLFKNLVNLGIERALSIYKTAKKRGITPRQLEVAQLVALGFTNTQIAQRLEIGKEGVRTHLKKIYPKLESHRRPEAFHRFFGYE